MHIDARNIENNSLIEGDICIVGSGAAGISIALEFLNTPYKVILLEGGGFEYEKQMQDLYKGKTTGQRYYPLDSARLHYFGGTTGHWSGFCSTFDPIDFKERDWVPHSGWPITRQDLDAYYPRAHKNLDLGPYEYDVKYWQGKDPELRSLPFKGDAVYNKMWQFSKPTRFGTKYRDTIIKAPNIHLYTYANVTDITGNENASAITQVTVKNLAGKQHTVKAKQFIIACCSIQNARLLLASNNQMPKGLGNQNDNVGRYFMEHLEIKSAELWLAKPDVLKLYHWEWEITKARAELAISEEMQRKHKILNGTASLIPLDIAKQQAAFIDIWTADTVQTKKNFAKFEKAEKDGAKKEGHSSYQLFTRVEQAPNPDSRVTLDTERDALGVPRAMLHWELTPLEKHSLRGIHKIIGEQIGITEAGRVRLMEYLRDENDNTWPEFTGGGWHHMGTTRMAADPKKGVVDANCKVHGIANLYMAGASCYATAAAPNPTLTLVALTIRLADHIKQKVKAV
ncbi:MULTISPECIES: GMC family oxidoreductase [unclassified Mucilaginibacter]|uniref:GMC family oxidoreductase n=1 Tax=unclassified Mucilaginibacter TaxID=2617802 RepID=UPI002AC94C87|nr:MULTISPECIES: GMC family oxidoreductase [unclassified Mucilaginibacter]MEB0263913.1 GMC family oxidoreductase [Mucilaginibacter sp. 10I4]MEB0277131.1 GMC family oxidoreductase [Mucilaginibacter sp. 10B2]MEB0301423.1 GMC family oxidoreductase [Mucilaginibacter sp. 5C4]WPX25231.1 GMC family oxidoreductase [Mucilaginibacter sp. 5C4]